MLLTGSYETSEAVIEGIHRYMIQVHSFPCQICHACHTLTLTLNFNLDRQLGGKMQIKVLVCLTSYGTSHEHINGMQSDTIQLANEILQV